MAAVAPASESEQAAAAREPTPTPAPAPACPRATLDPQLFMAARRGDRELLKDLLQIEEEDANAMWNCGIVETNGDHAHHGIGMVEAVAATEAVVTVDVVPRRSPAPAAAGAPPPKDAVTMEGDSLLHVVAACGDNENFLKCAEMIYNKANRLLAARNTKGDTPLHCAASAGNANMISLLIFLAATDVETSVEAMVRLRNECGETALHQAVRAPHNNVACIDRLMAVDSDLACIPPDDEEGGSSSSPLYLAISLGKLEIGEHLYDKSKRLNGGNAKLSYCGPDGRNALHAAVSRGQALPTILKWLKTMSSGSSVAAAPDLLSQLTSQRDKQHKGSTPLHLAASLEGWSHACFLSRRFPQVWPGSEATARLLLDANESTAYQADDEGSYPIHVAAASNGLGVVKLLLERCPDCATLRDGKGRTFLHVAAKNVAVRYGFWGGGGVRTKNDVVRYVVWGGMPQHLSRMMILNAQDSRGDTALHIAIRAGNVHVFDCLFRSQEVRLDVANKDGMTPLDLSWTMIPSGLHYTSNPTSIVYISLLAAGAPHGGGRPELLTEKRTTKHDLNKESKKYREATQAMTVVSALIATATFASAFQLPGGYRTDGAGKHIFAFHAFILADTMAFICSILATCALVYVGFPVIDISIRYKYLQASVVLLMLAATSFLIAFSVGLYLVQAPFFAYMIVFEFVAFYAIVQWSWTTICMTTTVIARIGIRRYAVLLTYE